MAKAANAQPVSVVDGRNATVTTAGGAGKTHTIDGLLPTVIDRIFKATNDGDFETSEVVSYLEFTTSRCATCWCRRPYRRTPIDRLLSPSVNLQNRLQGGVTVVGLSEQLVMLWRRKGPERGR